MNKTYRLIWNELSQSWVPAPEGARARGKRGGGTLRLAALSLALLAAGAVQAQALPSGGQIVAGSGSIAQNGNTLTITQTSDKLAANWQSFSIGAGQSVNFVQPGSSAIALNRVLGSDVSTIQGALNANGQVFLVNPNGVLFTSTAQVNVGGLVASTLNLSDADFMAGRYRFSGDSAASVVNAGSIQAAAGGNVALIAARISNSGSIATGDAGRVQLGAGRRVLLDLGGPAKLEVEEGALNALIEQGGAIRADGGLIYLTARSAGEISGSVIKHTGTSEARTLASGAKGEIYLLGDLARDSILVGGKLDASAPSGGDGGFIETSAARVHLADGRRINTLASAGKTGTWLIDPNDYTIAASGGDITGAQLSADLASTNVTIATTSQGTAGGNGDILVNDRIDWSGGNTLTLKAERDIQINQQIRHAAGTGDLILRSDSNADGTGAVKFASAATRYIDFTGSDGNIKLYYNPLGSGWAKYSSPTSFDKNIAMGGGALAPYMLINTGDDLSNFLRSTMFTSGYTFVALGRDIDPGAGNSLPEMRGGTFRGVFDGDGHTISNIKIGGSGLFGTLEGAILKNLTLDASNSIVLTTRGGALVNRASNSVIENVLNKADIRFTDYPFNDGGGLVGQFDYGVMINVENRGTLHVGSNSQGVGGIVGSMYGSSLYGVRNYGDILVKGTPLVEDTFGHGVGGIVNSANNSQLFDVQNHGNIDAQFATSTPSAGRYVIVGGIVGQAANATTIRHAENSGTISVAAAGRTYVGGIAGQVGGNSGTVFTAYDLISRGDFNISASLSTAPLNSYLYFGGLFGAMYGQGGAIVDASIAKFRLTMDLAANYDSSRAFSAGLVGSESGMASIQNSYWTNSGSALRFLDGVYNDGAGARLVMQNVVAKTAAQLLDPANYADSNTWGDWLLGDLGGQPPGSTPKLKHMLVAYSEPMLKYYDGQVYSAAAAAGHLKVLGGSLADVTGDAVVEGTFLSATQAKTGGAAGDASTLFLSGLRAADGDTSVLVNAGALSLIKPRLITVGADSQSKVYGQADPILTWQTTSGSMVSGDSVSGSITRSAGENAGIYTFSLAGLQFSSNYVVALQPGATFTINKAPLTITANDAGKTYDGLGWLGGNGVNYSGFVNGETAAVLGGTLTYGGNSQGARNAGSYALTAGGLSAANYAIHYVPGALTIDKAPLVITANNAGKTYDGLGWTGGDGVSYGGFVNGETSAVLGGSLVYGGNSQGARNAGSYVLTPGGLSSGNYAISYVNGALTISKLALTLSGLVAANKVYDGGVAASLTGTATLSGALAGDVVNLSGPVTGQFADANAGSNKTVVISGLSLGGADAGNYSVTGTTGFSATISAAPLTISANDASKTYDRLGWSGGNGISYSGFVNGETAAVLGGSLVYGGNGQGAVNAGSYVLVPGGLSSGNYAISYVPGTLTINKAVLTVNGLTVADKVYDGSASASIGGTASLSGVLAGDAVSAGGTLSGQFVDANAGSGKAVFLTGLTLSGAQAGNYLLMAPADLSATIGAAPLVITANNAGKTYDGLGWTGGNGVGYSGFVNGETMAVLGGSLVYGGSSQGASNAGSYVLTVGGLSSGNYAISYVPGSLAIAPRAITVMADNAGKVYGNADPRLAYRVTNGSLVQGDSLAGALTRVAGENVGSYKIDASALANGNYAITAVDGVLSIMPRAITVTADNASKVYGEADPRLAYRVTNGSLVQGDSLAGALTRVAGENVGSYKIDASALANGNYAITAVDGVLSITPRAITVTADNAGKVYGEADPRLAYRVTNGSLVQGDSLAGALTRVAGENVGSYKIDASALANGNYAITAVDGQLSITPRAITVTADNLGKVYGEADPTLAWRVTSGSLVRGDSLAGVLTRVAGENVGSYKIDASALANGNYVITAVNGQLSITPRAITVTADDLSKIRGDADPRLSWRVTSGSLVAGDSLAGVLTRAPGEDIGSYKIDASALANGNYLITAVDGRLSIIHPAAGTAALQTAQSSGARVSMPTAPVYAAAASRPQLQDSSSLNLVPVSAGGVAAAMAGGGRDIGGALRVLVVDGGLRLPALASAPVESRGAAAP
ncbi:MBG domain-containing protein [Roseateles sp.]|uniref:MBG domain-containing protein n=1 Tax=Roseateles sp. TaxID=1971397 RepID=UPI0025F6CE6B|nr:MBG domain-containing protein [Roseateles sp.]MBV8036797.1 filamentous hemagglutinin N-terminal domain-containing protein [Roseateles sp.]